MRAGDKGEVGTADADARWTAGSQNLATTRKQGPQRSLLFKHPPLHPHTAAQEAAARLQSGNFLQVFQPPENPPNSALP